MEHYIPQAPVCGLLQGTCRGVCERCCQQYLKGYPMQQDVNGWHAMQDVKAHLNGRPFNGVELVVCGDGPVHEVGVQVVHPQLLQRLPGRPLAHARGSCCAAASAHTSRFKSPEHRDGQPRPRLQCLPWGLVMYVCKQASTCFECQQKGQRSSFIEMCLSSIVSTACLPVQGTLKAGTL